MTPRDYRSEVLFASALIEADCLDLIPGHVARMYFRQISSEIRAEAKVRYAFGYYYAESLNRHRWIAA